MNRAERRRQQRELEKKTKDELSVMKKLCGRSEKTNAIDWALNLKTKEQEYLNFMMKENSKHDIQVYIDAYSMALRVNLNNEELINKINRDVEKEGYKVKEYRDNGGDYIMSLKNNKEQIIKDYKKGIAENIKEKDLIKDLAVNYRATVNAIKLVINDYKKSKEKPCSSKTCPFQKGDKCTNETVLSGKGECQQLNVNNIKVTKDTETVTKKDKIFKFIDEHKDLVKDKLYDEIQRNFNVTRDTTRKYYSLYQKSKEFVEHTRETINKINTNCNEKLNKEPKFKVLKETVIRDIQGEHGVYHIENGVMKIEDTVYTREEDVKQDYSDTVQIIELEFQEKVRELEKYKNEKMHNAESSKDEALEIMKEFM